MPPKGSVLDLGACAQETVNTFRELRARVRVEDLGSSLGRDDGEILDPSVFGGTYDLILCWDLLNYLSASRAAEVLLGLAQTCAPGASLYALFSTLLVMPEKPAVFSLCPGARVSFRSATPRLVECPRYSPKELEKRIAGISIAKLVLLQNGFYEILFVKE